MASRLALAFALVVVVAVVVFGLLTWRTTKSQVGALIQSRHATTERTVATLLEAAYAAAGSWQSADIFPARLLARSGGAVLVIEDPAGAVVRLAPTGVRLRRLGSPQQVPLVVGDRRVGTASFRFALAIPAAEGAVRRAIGRTVLWAGALAALAAAGVGVLVARGISRPLRTLTGAARSVAAGDRSARGGAAAEPAEIGELGRAFDRMAETLEREDGLRRAFAADVAHELRTPLAIVQGELELLLDGVEQPTAERLASLHEEMLRLARIVEDVEALAAAEGARFRLERGPVDLAEVVGDALAHLQAQAEGAGLALRSSLEPVTVEADRARLEQIVHNLVGNALKFTPAGGTVSVSVAAADGQGRLVVADSGPGIDDDELGHVFERFWRGRAGLDTDGSGVGLAVAAELVRAHEGSIEATRGDDGGARFTVTLPGGKRDLHTASTLPPR